MKLGDIFGSDGSKRSRSGEVELLKNKRSRITENSVGKSCSNVNCESMGEILELKWFYQKGDKFSSQCRMCKRLAVANWRLFNPDWRDKAVQKKGVKVRTSWNLNLGKAPWCEEHKMNSKECQCADGVFHRTPAQRAKVSAAMQGNSNAMGPHKKRGPLPTAHKIKLAAAMRESHRIRKEKKNGNAEGV